MNTRRSGALSCSLFKNGRRSSFPFRYFVSSERRSETSNSGFRRIVRRVLRKFRWELNIFRSACGFISLSFHSRRSERPGQTTAFIFSSVSHVAERMLSPRLRALRSKLKLIFNVQSRRPFRAMVCVRRYVVSIRALCGAWSETFVRYLMSLVFRVTFIRDAM